MLGRRPSRGGEGACSPGLPVESGFHFRLGGQFEQRARTTRRFAASSTPAHAGSAMRSRRDRVRLLAGGRIGGGGANTVEYLAQTETEAAGDGTCRQGTLRGRSKGSGANHHFRRPTEAARLQRRHARDRYAGRDRRARPSDAVRRFQRHPKEFLHHSNIYSGAPMPFMQRITWSGVAMHEGVNLGHPASHGCIRMSHDFATRLWVLTRLGARVIIARPELRPEDFSDPRLFVQRDPRACAGLQPPRLPCQRRAKVAQNCRKAPTMARRRTRPAKQSERSKGRRPWISRLNRPPPGNKSRRPQPKRRSCWQPLDPTRPTRPPGRNAFQCRGRD